jgi:hypothetical protein
MPRVPVHRIPYQLFDEGERLQPASASLLQLLGPKMRRLSPAYPARPYRHPLPRWNPDLTSRALTGDGVINEQHDDRADDRYDHAVNIEAGDAFGAKETK